MSTVRPLVYELAVHADDSVRYALVRLGLGWGAKEHEHGEATSDRRSLVTYAVKLVKSGGVRLRRGDWHTGLSLRWIAKREGNEVRRFLLLGIVGIELFERGQYSGLPLGSGIEVASHAS